MFLRLFIAGWLVYYLYSLRAVLATKFFQARLRAGDYDGALRRLRLMAFLLPKARAKFCEALILALEGRVAEAERLLREAVVETRGRAALQPERTYCLLGYELTELGRYEEAEESFHQSIAAGDVTGNSQNGLSELRLRQGRLEEALAFADQAIERAKRRVKLPITPLYYADRALILASLGRNDEAGAALALAAATPPAYDSAASRATLEWKTGLTLLQLAKTAEACQHFRSGCHVDPNGKYGGRCLEELRKAGAEPGAVPSQSGIGLRPVKWWSVGMKKSTAIAALLVLGIVGCPLVMQVRPGRLPDFSDTRTVYRFAGGRWIATQPFPGGVENIQVSPGGVVWATAKWGTELVRWDGARWSRYRGSDIAVAEAVLSGGFALQGETAWVPTTAGVASYDNGNWRLYPEVVKTPSETAIAAGAADVWVIDESADLSHFDGTAWSIENLKNTPAGVNWDERVEDNRLQLRTTADGAVWLLLDGLWRRDDSGWRRLEMRNVDWEVAQLAGTHGDNVWVRTRSHLFEVTPDDALGALYSPRELPVDPRASLWGAATADGRTWLATSKDLLVSDGAAWRHCGIPPHTTMVREVAVGSGGSAWVVSETRQVGRIALWLAPVLAACSLAMLVIGLLLVMWTKSAAQERLAADRAVLRAAGAIPGIDEAAREAEVKRRGRVLWWTVPAVLIGFPFMVTAIGWGRTYLRGKWLGAPEWVSWAAVLAPIALAVLFPAMRRFRRRKQSGPSLIGSEIWLVLFFAVFFFFFRRLPLPRWVNTDWLWVPGILAFIVLLQLRNILAVYGTKQLWLSGQYDRALRRLRWLKMAGRPTAVMLQVEGTVLSTAGRQAEAEACYRRALSSAGSSSPEFRRSVLCCLGFTLTEMARYDEAQRCFETVIELGDKTGGARMGIADLLLVQAKEPEKALGLIDQAMRIRLPKLVFADRMGSKAWALALIGRLQEMGESISTAVHGINPAQKAVAASVHWKVGKALAAVERIPEAIEHFRAAIQADPHGHCGQISRCELEHYGAAG